MAKFEKLTNHLKEKSDDSLELSSSFIEELTGQVFTDIYFKDKTAFYKGSSLGKAMLEGGYLFDKLLESNKEERFFKIAIAKATEERLAKRKKGTPKAIVLNKDLPANIEKDGIKVLDNKHNANEIRKFVSTFHRYAYTSFIKDVFEKTAPKKNQQPTLNTIIARLVCIDNIDGTNLSKSSVKYGFKAFAESIQKANLEDLIRNRKPIPNKDFISIAKRIGISNPKSYKRFFSAISKYIARTAYYCYGIDDVYSIYDDVLRNHLHLYIKGFTPQEVSKLKNKCDYQGYCDRINGYLKAKNATLPKEEQLTNMDFDQIVWFSYKNPNAEPKYK